MSPENISYSTSPLLTQWSSIFLGHGFLYYLILFRLSFATASSFLDSLSMSQSFLSSDFKFSLPRWRIESWILRVHSSLSLHCWYTAIQQPLRLPAAFILLASIKLNFSPSLLSLLRTKFPHWFFQILLKVPSNNYFEFYYPIPTPNAFCLLLSLLPHTCLFHLPTETPTLALPCCWAYSSLPWHSSP